MQDLIDMFKILICKHDRVKCIPFLFLCIRKWNDAIVADVSALLAKELYLPPGTPGGMENYRSTLALSFFFKFYLSVQIKLHEKNQVSSIIGSIIPI